MLNTRFSRRGMVTAPSHLAAQAGLAILREGGNAIEAMIAAAATAAVVYPHMTGLGGDAFWLIAEPGRPVVSIDGSGAAGSAVSATRLREAGQTQMPRHGPAAAATVAGALSAWQSALDISARWGGRLPLARLLEEAGHHARAGHPVSASQERSLRRSLAALRDQPGFAACFLDSRGHIPRAGSLQTNPALAATLDTLVAEGLDSFYRGAVGQTIAADLAATGAPIKAGDLARHRPVRRRPLALGWDQLVVHAPPPPSQGLTTLMLLGLFARAPALAPGPGPGPGPGGRRPTDDGPAFIHTMVEAAKIAYGVRNARLTDPRHMGVHATTYLSGEVLAGLARDIDPDRAGPWPHHSTPGDTVWMGAVDAEGRAVSCSHSLAHAFGSGVVLPATGLIWHNRAAAFALDETAVNPLMPGRKPPHTLSPTLARGRDGRTVLLGTMGGDGQPQTLAAILVRHHLFGQSLQTAISAPRWVIGRGWTDPGEDLKVESRLPADWIAALTALGHRVTRVDDYDDLMGHAGAILVHPDGTLEGASDPRADGAVAAW